ncbi:DUF1449 domain-containing protein [Exilibacterium tricleocarpae]|uniref:DUF1449 domain-containing protein n=1 Tax=Exilibacterium tricleocarpae TaxID=2591008 RepID=A0A545TFN2_9GAMM|nr:DUF1449 domain-containing protein [Exilibacterium tricleocarpae]TQV75986.1 DUF1449 domain-containing protein [Exilibacterium tricleocarpae]
MFAVLLSKEMDPFYQNVSSFPTVFFTFFLILTLLFWLVAVLGLVDIDAFDIPGTDLEIGDGNTSTPDAVAGVILKLGLNGVPLSVVISLVSLIGWFISYNTVHFFSYLIPSAGLARFLVGLPVLLGALYLSVLATGFLIRPLRPLFKKMQRHTEKMVLGQTAVVRTSRVDPGFGEAIFDDGGAGLILKVRASEGQQFGKGDRVVLIEYLKDANAYRVVSEEEFNG